jgi:hypothetical protein
MALLYHNLEKTFGFARLLLLAFHPRKGEYPRNRKEGP